MGEVIVVIGTGQIGQAIARRVSFGKHVLLADLHQGIGLQQHHRGHHPRRHRRASQRRALEQIGEILIAKQRITVLGQRPITLPCTS